MPGLILFVPGLRRASFFGCAGADAGPHVCVITKNYNQIASVTNKLYVIVSDH